MVAAPAVRPAVWTYFPHVIFYRTGFPFELLERLSSPAAVHAAEQCEQTAADLDALRAALLRRAIPAAVGAARAQPAPRPALRALSRARSRVGRRGPVPPGVTAALTPALPRLATALELWNTLLARLQAETAAARHEVARATTAGRQALRAIAADPRFQEAVFTSNPNLYPGPLGRYLDGWQDADRPSATRRFERTLASYVQRAAAKTDVSGLFGPIDFALLDPVETRPVTLHHPDDAIITDREVFFSFWAVEALAAAVSADPEVRPALRPRLSPLCEVLDGGAAYLHVADQTVALSASERALLALADGERTVAALASAAGLHLAEALTTLERLAAHGLLSLSIDIPSTTFHPFHALLAFVHGLPEIGGARGRWLAELEALDALRRAFRDAPLAGRTAHFDEIERRFRALSGQSPRRRQGEMYADRTVLYEDCRGAARDFRFGRPFIERLQREVGPSLELCAAYGRLWREHYQAMSLQAYASLGAGGEPVSFSRYVTRLQELGRAGAFAPRSAAMQEFEQAWTELVWERAAAEGGRVARLTAADLAPLLGRAPAGPRNAHAAPDLLLGARDEAALARGEVQIVIGEVGENIYIWGSQFWFYERREQANRDVADMLARLPDYKPLAFILARRPHKGLLSEAFAGTFIDAEACSVRPAAERPAFRDLFVAPRNGELALLTRAGDALQLFHHHDELVHLWTFAAPRIAIPPLLIEGHLPRIEVDGVVLRREEWTVRPADLIPAGADQAGRFRAVRRAVRRLGLPEFVFVHLPGEIKPFAIDLGSALGVELLAHLLTDTSEARLIEMLPRPDQLWLRDQGGRYCTEFRFLAMRD